MRKVVYVLCTMLLVAGFGLTSAAYAASASSEPQFPAKDIKLLVNVRVGGGFDVVARILAQAMNTSGVLPKGVQTRVTNVDGAGGQTGAITLYNAPADGYTIGMFYMGGIFTAQALEGVGKRGYDISKFSYITNIAQDDWSIIVNKDSPYKSIDDLRKAKILRWGALAMGDEFSMDAVIVANSMGLPLSGFVTGFKGTSDMWVAQMRGDIDVHVCTALTPPLMALIKEGSLRVLAIVGGRPVKYLPQVPTTDQLGYNFRVLPFIRPVLAPPNTPPKIVSALQNILLKTFESNDFRKWAKDQPQMLDVPQRGTETQQMIIESMRFVEKHKKAIETAMAKFK